ncbi:MAG: hypothetical protein WAQ27_04315 [Candidatus Microsaccharimonas sp.]
MVLGFDFSKIFGSGTPAPAPATPNPTNNPAQNQPPAQPASSTVTAPNGTVPADGNKPGEQSPTAKYADLWEPPKTEEPKPGEQSQALTPEKMLEAASKVDFRKVLDQESLAKIQAGGPEAVGALADLLNKTGQTVYGQSVVVSKRLIDDAVQQARTEFMKELPSLVRRQTAQEALISDNPAFKDPAVAPVVAAVQAQMQAKFPKATASELNEMAREYLRNAASVLSSDPKALAAQTAATRKKSDAEDWDSWMSTPLSSNES